MPELRDEQDRQEAKKSNARTLEEFLGGESFADHLSQILPATFNTARFATIALRQTRNIPELALCDLSTVAASVMEAAGLGLEIGINGECWIIPRQISKGKDSKGNWKPKVWEAGLQIGYLGHLTLGWRSTMIAGVQADVVIEGDAIEFEKGTKGYLRHRQKKGRIVKMETIEYAYMVVDTIYGGTVWDIIDRVEIERIRNSGPSSNSPAWRDWPDQMAQGKVAKRALKFGPKSREIARAITLDDAIDAGIHQTWHGDLPAIPATLPTSPTTQNVEGALRRSAAARTEGSDSQEEPPPPGDDSVPPMEDDQREPVPAAQSRFKKPTGNLGF